MRNLFQGVVLALFLAGSAMAQVMGPSGNIPYTANGGSVARTPSAQSADVTNTVNYGATAGGTNTTPMTNALAQSLSSGGGAVWVPGGYAGTWSYAYPDPSVFQEFDGPNINRSQLGFGAAATDSNKVFSGVLGTTRPSSNNRAGVSDWWWSQGSGANGANHADFAHSFYEQKQNYNCSTARQAAAQCATVALQGENDVLYIAGYQGGPDATSSASLKSAGGLATGSETCVGGIGFCLQLEFHTDILDPSTLAVALDMDTQYGAVNTRTGEQTGYGIYENLNSNAGGYNINAAYGATGSAGSAWNRFLENAYGGAVNWAVADNGAITWGASSSPSNQTVETNTGTATARTALGTLAWLDGNGSLKGAINKDGTISAVTGLADDAIPAWTTSTAYTFGNLVTSNGYVVQVTNVGGTSSVAPNISTGCTTGADSIQWCYRATVTSNSASGHGEVIDFTGAQARMTAPLYLQSIQQSPSNVPVFAGPGSPAGVATSGKGGLFLRNDGSNGRTGYLNEGGATGTWNPIITATVSNTVAAAGANLAGATVLTSRWNYVTSGTGGVALDGTLLPDEQIVSNRTGSAINVYPPSSSAQIDAYGVGNPVVLNTLSQAVFYCPQTTQCWTRQQPTPPMGYSADPTCGTGCSSISAASTNYRMKITTGAVVTSITVNFGGGLPQTPVCAANNEAGTPVAISFSAVSTSAITLVTASAVTSQVLDMICQ